MRRWDCPLKRSSQPSWLIIWTVSACRPRQYAVCRLTISAGEKVTVEDWRATASAGETSILKTLGLWDELIEISMVRGLLRSLAAEQPLLSLLPAPTGPTGSRFSL